MQATVVPNPSGRITRKEPGLAPVKFCARVLRGFDVETSNAVTTSFDPITAVDAGLQLGSVAYRARDAAIAVESAPADCPMWERAAGRLIARRARRREEAASHGRSLPSRFSTSRSFEGRSRS